MRMPKLAETRLYMKRLDSFGGIRRVGQVRDGEFSEVIKRLDSFLTDGYVDRFESSSIVNMLGHALAQLNND